ncbi:MAG: hypothetical protein RL112_1687 [Planctomycetota bacterium]
MQAPPVGTPCLSRLPEPWSSAAKAVAGRLAELGHRAWLVGGCVRDLALARPVADADLCSDARPEVVQAAFPRTVPTGIEFGTVLVVLEGASVEHTTYRLETTYSDGRRPDSVRFGTDLVEDARRRDFTVNALYLDPLTNEVRDPTGGLADLKAGLLRAIGDPEERFREDSLRLLRLVRFAATLGFEVEERTLLAAQGLAPSLARMARERVHKELAGACARGDLSRFLRLLEACRLVVPTFGEELPRIDSRVARLSAWPRPTSLADGLAAILAPVEDELEAPLELSLARAERVLQGLKCSRHEQDGCLDALACAHELLLEPWPSRSRRILRARRLGFACGLRLARLSRPAIEAWDAIEDEVRRLGPAGLHPAPLLSAEDLLALGVPRGPALGQWLRRLETLQLDGEVLDRAAAEARVRAGSS